MNTQQFNFRQMYVLSAIVLLIMFGISAYGWFAIPAGEQIPVHFDATGTPDRYGGKFEGLMLLPLISTGLVLLLAALPRLEPRRNNMLQSQKAYQAVWAGVLVMMGIIHAGVIMSVLGSGLNFGRIVPVLVGILFMVVGNFMGKTRSNWFMGIRTPWTLSSDLSWDKTHRLGGKLFVGFGLLFMISALFPLSEAVVGVLVVGITLMTIFLYGYSYLVWKNDPNIQSSQS